MSEIKDTLADRGQIYGENWDCYMGLKMEVNQSKMDARQRYCMDMILMKISRLSAGDPNDADTWHDIAGYALLAEKGIPAKPKPKAQTPIVEPQPPGSIY